MDNPQETSLGGILRDSTLGSLLTFATVQISADWVVGFVDGEGCFHVSIVRNPTTSTGYQVIPEFVVVQHKRSIQVLYALKAFFRCGVVRPNREERYAYRVRKLACLEAIADFFLRHPLKTTKQQDFLVFRRILFFMKEGKHLSIKGLLEIAEEVERMSETEREALQNIKKEIQHRLAKEEGPQASSRESPPLAER